LKEEMQISFCSICIRVSSAREDSEELIQSHGQIREAVFFWEKRYIWHTKKNENGTQTEHKQNENKTEIEC
jgi:hypothetical protein